MGFQLIYQPHRGNFQSFLATLPFKSSTELQRQLAFTTSSTKKRKLSPQHTQGQDLVNSPDIPLKSVEDRESQSPCDLPRFDLPTDEDGRSDSTLPPPIPTYLQNPSSLATADYISSAASSPSAAYAGLSIENEGGADLSGSEQRRGSLEPNNQDSRKQSPLLPFAHRSIMGGAADFPQRSSSPLKRRASDLETGAVSSQPDDVDMIQIPSGPSGEPGEPESVESDLPANQTSRSRRAQSIDMLREEIEDVSQSRGSDHATSPDSANEELPVIKNKADIPPIDVQIQTVTTMIQTFSLNQVNDGDKAYLVSRLWLSRVTSRGSEARKSDKREPEGEIGPVDNSDITQQIIKDCDGNDFAQLKHGVGSESFELFSQEAWDLIIQWYGLMPGSIPIIRQAHNTARGHGIPNIIYEYHPLVFTVHRLWSDVANNLSQIAKAQKAPVPIFVVSRSDRYMHFLKRIKEKAGIDMSRKVRVWRVPRSQPAAEPVEQAVSTSTPPSSRPNSPDQGVSVQNPREPQDHWNTLLLDVKTFLDLKKGDGRELVDAAEDQTNNPNYNGQIDLSFVGLGDDQAIVLDERIENQYVSTFTATTKGQKSAAGRTSTSYIPPNSQANSGRNSPAPQHNTRSRSQKSGRSQGSVGLSNLGNTCYMNSALQCVRSVEELTKYFLTGVGETELNRDNPLGNGGEVAIAYESLLREMYKEPPPTSVAPRHFKNTIGKYAPSFSGYAQQDSQEFLGFLLDGLQEDLSRVKKKPYIEKPDSTDEMVNNPAAIREMAEKVWDITKKRDDSVIADLFTGMYKSTLVCPVCAKVSITFDPFNNVTLQLPIENNWAHSVYYFPLNDKPMMITVDMDKQASILGLKHYMSKKVDVPVDRLFVAEEFKCKFFKNFGDGDQASEVITSSDNIAVYELECKPTNWPAPIKATKKQKYKKHLDFGNSNESDEDETPEWKDPMAQKLLVPVLHRRPNNTEQKSYNRHSPWISMPAPHYIIVTPEEAINEDMIRRKVLEKVATFTTHPTFADDEDADASTNGSLDPDLVIANGSDSSGESKVVANSIDGEDSIVNVTMKESRGVSPAESVNSKSQSSPVSKPTFKRRRPKFIDPTVYLAPDLQNMFSLGYFKDSKNEFPTGWVEVTEDKTYPSLASRSPIPPALPDDSGTDLEMTNRRTDSESSNDERVDNFAPATRMNEESSEDELSQPQTRSRVLPVRPATHGGSGRRNRKMKTYSKKGNKFFRKSPPASNDDYEAPDGGPLIRLGEGIVVDWTQDAYDHMFEGAKGDENMGRPTYVSIPTFDDVELTAKRLARNRRRKNGITLDDCLNEFGKEEVLSEADTWYCPRCKEHRRATKKFELWKTPDILVMHLKRFSSSGWRRDKLDVLVDFPLDGLDLSSRVVETEPGKTEIYDLIAVDDHWGGLGGGHYTAFAKSFIDQEWYEYNDSSVSKLKDLSRIVTSSAYLLFYRRRSEVPLGGPRFQQIFDAYDHHSSPSSSSEDDQPDSGEGRGLVANSSQHGSSSALTGVGAALHPANRGSGLIGQTMIVDPQDLDGLPPYHEGNDSDATPLLMGDSDMNDGDAVPSIEDEGVDLNFNNLNNLTAAGPHSNWSFANINAHRNNSFVSGTGSEIDGNENAPDVNFDVDGSDVVQDASSATSGSRRGRLDDFDNAIPETEDGLYVDDNPVPDMIDDGRLDPLQLHREFMMSQRPEFKVPAEQSEEIEDQAATEIHLDEGEGL